MVVAKTEDALTKLAKQFYDRTTSRRYWALVWGNVKEDGTVEGNLGRSLKKQKNNVCVSRRRFRKACSDTLQGFEKLWTCNFGRM